MGKTCWDLAALSRERYMLEAALAAVERDNDLVQAAYLRERLSYVMADQSQCLTEMQEVSGEAV